MSIHVPMATHILFIYYDNEFHIYLSFHTANMKMSQFFCLHHMNSSIFNILSELISKLMGNAVQLQRRIKCLVAEHVTSARDSTLNDSVDSAYFIIMYSCFKALCHYAILVCNVLSPILHATNVIWQIFNIFIDNTPRNGTVHCA